MQTLMNCKYPRTGGSRGPCTLRHRSQYLGTDAEGRHPATVPAQRSHRIIASGDGLDATSKPRQRQHHHSGRQQAPSRRRRGPRAPSPRRGQATHSGKWLRPGTISKVERASVTTAATGDTPASPTAGSRCRSPFLWRLATTALGATDRVPKRVEPSRQRRLPPEPRLSRADVRKHRPQFATQAPFEAREAEIVVPVEAERTLPDFRVRHVPVTDCEHIDAAIIAGKFWRLLAHDDYQLALPDRSTGDTGAT
jgi:hypothetical protein